MFDQTFFKFVTGFTLILAASFIVMYIATVIHDEPSAADIQAVDNTAAAVIESLK